MLTLHDDVICGSIFPLLSVRDLQSLDTAYTNKDLRPHLRRLWTLYNYDCGDVLVNKNGFLWLSTVGVRIKALRIIWHHGEEEHIKALLTRNSTLKELTIESQNATNNMLFHLAQFCPQLEVLQLAPSRHTTAYSEKGLIAVAQNCHQLHTISWESDHTTCTSIQALCDNCPHLRRIHCNELSDSSLISIARTYPHLQSISIKGKNVTDTGLLALAEKCCDLKTVCARYCRDVTSSGLAAIWATNPNLTDIDISCNLFISDDDIMILLQCCPQLNTINLACCGMISDAAVIAVAEHCPQLTSCNIHRCCNISDDALIALGRHCHGLKSINITWIKNISDVGISVLAAGCPLLQEFRAMETNITDTGMIALTSSCRDLRKIDVSWCQSIGLDAISAIAKNCPVIYEMDVYFCKFVDDSYLSVVAEHCRNLTRLTHMKKPT